MDKTEQAKELIELLTDKELEKLLEILKAK